MQFPREDGYYMPGEYEKHAKTWMVWPERLDTFRNSAYDAQLAFLSVAKAIIKFEPVTMCCSSFDKVLPSLVDIDKNTGIDSNTGIQFVEISSNDSWARDIGPTFVKNRSTGEVRGVDWRFNAWGGKYDGLYSDWKDDDAFATKVCSKENKECYHLEDFILEGGSIHVDGDGTCITTEACLLSAGRNSNKTKGEIEEYLRQYLNVERVIWLKNGIYLDETNEHVDNMINFISPGKVTLAWTDDVNDNQYEYSIAAFEVLTESLDARNRKFEIIKLQVPGPLFVTEDEFRSYNNYESDNNNCLVKAHDRLPASYTNFYLCNNAAIVPIFGDEKNDNNAISILKSVMPDREIIPIYSREILLGGGNVHCITQQQPA
jgi:agmatine deiminase